MNVEKRVKGLCWPVRPTESSEQSGESGSSLFLADCFLFGLLGCGSGCGGSGGSSGGGGSGCGRGESCASDSLFDVDSLERSNQCFDLGCVSIDSGGGQDGLESVLGDVLASRVEHHCTVDILHLFQLLIFSRIMH